MSSAHRLPGPVPRACASRPQQTLRPSPRSSLTLISVPETPLPVSPTALSPPPLPQAQGSRQTLSRKTRRVAGRTAHRLCRVLIQKSRILRRDLRAFNQVQALRAGSVRLRTQGTVKPPESPAQLLGPREADLVWSTWLPSARLSRTSEATRGQSPKLLRAAGHRSRRPAAESTPPVSLDRGGTQATTGDSDPLQEPLNVTTHLLHCSGLEPALPPHQEVLVTAGD